MDVRQGFVELEAWLASLDPPRLPSEPELELLEWFYDISLVEAQVRAEGRRPPEGGDALGLFTEGDP